jgi:opacity protein-like surface antigen
MPMMRILIAAAVACGLAGAASASQTAPVSDLNAVSVDYMKKGGKGFKFKGRKGYKVKYKKPKHFRYYAYPRPRAYRYRYYRPHYYGYRRYYRPAFYGYYRPRARRCYCL